MDYKTLVVWDSHELDQLEKNLLDEKQRLFLVYEKAKIEKRKVVWKNAQFDLKRIERVVDTISKVRKDPDREW